jgi:4'-phosphopantetheinyl transferase
MAFNLAHSGRWVVYGMSLASCLGVDVETITPRACLESLIDRCLTPHEIAVLPTKPAARLRAFYQHWSIKEAHLKAVGLGISYPMSQVHIGWHPTLHLKQPAIAPHVALNDWTVQVWNLSEDVVAAACIGASYHRLLIQPFPLPSSS